MDLRPGGAWRYLCRISDGEELAWHGGYREIEAPARIVSTEVFEGFPDAESLNTMTLSEDHGVTTLQTLVQHSSKANLAGHVDSGMEGGMPQTSTAWTTWSNGRNRSPSRRWDSAVVTRAGLAE